MDIRTYRRKEVIFHQDDPGDCMYDIHFGRVGIFYDYGGPDEKKLAELMTDQLFGEMGLLDHAPRSATAVALDNDTQIEVITEDDFLAFFEENPPKVLTLMQMMCNRLRHTTKDYLEACNTVREVAEAVKSGKPRTDSLKDRIVKFCKRYLDASRP